MRPTYLCSLPCPTWQNDSDAEHVKKLFPLTHNGVSVNLFFKSEFLSLYHYDFSLTITSLWRKHPSSLQDMDVPLLTHVFEHFWPHSDADLSQMRLLEEKHQGSGLTNTPPDAEWDFIIDNRLVIGKFEEVQLAGHFQLPF
jgi:hypothetical protein